MIWIDVLHYLGALTGISVVVGYLGKQILNKSLDIGLENYKGRLSKEIENHKSDLARITAEHQITYVRLHEERANIIKGLYQRMVELQSILLDVTELFSPSFYQNYPKNKDKVISVKRFNERLIDFQNYYLANRIFFSKTICSKVDFTIKEFKSKIWDHEEIQKQIIENFTNDERVLELAKRKVELVRVVNFDFPDLINEIENDFRLILGVKN